MEKMGIGEEEGTDEMAMEEGGEAVGYT